MPADSQPRVEDVERLAAHNFAFVTGDSRQWLAVGEDLRDPYLDEARGILKMLMAVGWAQPAKSVKIDAEHEAEYVEADKYFTWLSNDYPLATNVDHMHQMIMHQAVAELKLVSYYGDEKIGSGAAWFTVNMASYLVSDYLAKKNSGLLLWRDRDKLDV